MSCFFSATFLTASQIPFQSLSFKGRSQGSAVLFQFQKSHKIQARRKRVLVNANVAFKLEEKDSREERKMRKNSQMIMHLRQGSSQHPTQLPEVGGWQEGVQLTVKQEQSSPGIRWPAKPCKEQGLHERLPRAHEEGTKGKQALDTVRCQARWQAEVKSS